MFSTQALHAASPHACNWTVKRRERRAPVQEFKARNRGWEKSLHEQGAALEKLASGLLPVLLATSSFAATDSNTPIHFAGSPVEMTISEISERTFRVQLAPLDDRGKTRAHSASTILVPFPSVEKLRTRELTGEREVRVGQLRVSIHPSPLSLSVRRADGSLVQEVTFEERDGTNWFSFHTAAPVFGLGEGEQQFDRRGHYYRMRNGQIAPMLATHGATIPVPFLIGTDGWALFVHRPWGEVDLRENKRGRFILQQEAAASEPVDLFVVSLNEPADALTEYIRLTGRPVMPPKWTMGYIQSHRTLLGPDDPLQIARTFRKKQLPCDALIYLGTGYCTNGWNVVNGTIDFNPNAFPRPVEQIETLQAEHFKVILHVNQAPRNLFGTTISQRRESDLTTRPLTPSDGERVPRGRVRGSSATSAPDLFSRGPYLTLEERRSVVPPAADETEDFNSPVHIGNYWNWHRPVFALGIDGWWPDDGDELPIEARLARHRCYFEGPLQDRPNERPWSLHRNGYAGVQRYGGWIWSGDTQSRWATLAAHVPVGLNHSLSLAPFWGTDIGGFVITSELTGELYVRWFQFGAFNPLFRSHGRTWHLRLPWGWNTGEPGPIESRDVTDRDELHNAEVEPICREYLELRYRLLPYNYTLAREACDTGLPPMRALWLHYPDDPRAVKLGDEYLWGRELLVAPVVEKGAKTRRVYLPKGNWFDWWTNEKIKGERWIDRPVDLATLPLYVRAGAIIPLDPVRQFTSQPVSDPTTLRVFPGADGEFTLYDDDGQSMGYLDGSDAKMAWVRFRWNDDSRRLILSPDERMKRWPGGSREFVIEIAGSDAAPKSVSFEGKRIEVNL